MRCEEVRPLLAGIDDGVTDGAAGHSAEAQSHLASCRACSADLRRYRETLLQLCAIRDDLVEPPAGALARTLARVPAWRRERLARRAISDDRLRYAAFSVAGLLLGAAAVSFLRRRAARRNIAAPVLAG